MTARIPSSTDAQQQLAVQLEGVSVGGKLNSASFQSDANNETGVQFAQGHNPQQPERIRSKRFQEFHAQHVTNLNSVVKPTAAISDDSGARSDISNTEQHGQWVVSRKVDTHVDKKVYRTERVQRRVLPDAEWRAAYQHNPATLVDHCGGSEKLTLGSLTQPVQETRTTRRNLNYHPASSADIHVAGTAAEGGGDHETQHASQRAHAKTTAGNDLEARMSARDDDGQSRDASSNVVDDKDVFVVDEDGRLVRRNTSQVTQQEVTTVTRVYRTLEPVAADYQLQPSVDYQLDGGEDHYEQRFASDGNVYPRTQQERRRYRDHHQRHQRQQYQGGGDSGPNFNMMQHAAEQEDQLSMASGFQDATHASEAANGAVDGVLYAARYDYEHYQSAGGAAGGGDQNSDIVDYAASQQQAASEISEPGYEHIRPLLPPKVRTKTSYENHYNMATAAAASLTDADEGQPYESIPPRRGSKQHSIGSMNGGGGSPAAFHQQTPALVDIGFEYDYVTTNGDENFRQPVLYAAGEQQPLVSMQGHSIPPNQAQQSPPRPVPLRDPELPEVIQFLCHWNGVVRANAAAHLAHLCYMNDAVKAQARALGAIPLLVELLVADVPELQKNACCALRNLTYGKANDENKRAFLYAGGLPALARLYARISSPQGQHRTNETGRMGGNAGSAIELREAASATLWNLSSCDELKRPILDEALPAFLGTIIDLPAAAAANAVAMQQQQLNGQENGQPNNNNNHQQQQNLHYYNHQLSRMFHTALFRNVSGVLRNLSSDGQHARQTLRNGGTLLRALFAYLRMAVGEQDIDNKSSENCVCTVRNLAYRLQEIDDPNYEEHFYGGVGEIIYASPASVGTNGHYNGANNNSTNGRRGRSGSDDLGGPDITCFATPRRQQKNKANKNSSAKTTVPPVADLMPSAVARQVEILWSNEAVKCYLAILQHCANPDTLEAAAGVVQNLTACSWRPALHVRGVVRKEKGLPILVELLRMENDRVVCSVARALRNLALDEKNRDLIGKYAMNDLIAKIPQSMQQHQQRGGSTQANIQQQQIMQNSDETVAAILATINEAIASNQEFARVFVEHDGLAKLVRITQAHEQYGPKTVRFATHILHTLWRRHAGLHDLYKSTGFKEAQLLFTPPGYSESATNTLHRPFSSQGARRDDDDVGATMARQQQPPMSSALLAVAAEAKRQAMTTTTTTTAALKQKQLVVSNTRRGDGVELHHVVSPPTRHQYMMATQSEPQQQQGVLAVSDDPTRHSDSWV